jgi:hypothetical protein
MTPDTDRGTPADAESVTTPDAERHIATPNAVRLDVDAERANGTLPTATATRASTFTPQVQATIDAILSRRLRDMRNELTEANAIVRREMTARHAKQLVDMCAAKHAKPSSTPLPPAWG